MKGKPGQAIGHSLLLLSVVLFIHSNLSASKYYSYQSGNWSGMANVWTTDSTGSTLAGPSSPVFVNNDIICILTGRTITLNASVTTTGHVVTIVVGAVLDLGLNTFTQSIVLNGNGLIRSGRVTGGIAVFPTIASGNFLSLKGGTVEYYPATGSFYIDDNRPAYNNLVINLGSVNQVMTVRRNLTIFGSLTIKTGTFQVNDATNAKRAIVVNADFIVYGTGKVTTGTGNPNTAGYTINPLNLPPGGQFHTVFHELTIGGNFINNGIVRFTNQIVPNYGEFATNGAVTVRFTGESDKTLTLNGQTDFYNLIVDKGSDQTYILTVNSASVACFTLFGANACRRNENAPFSPDNPEVRKAVWIKNGTLKLTGSITIPTLAEGPVGTGNGDYAIGSSGQMWIAGPNVAVYVTASDNSGLPEAPAGSLGVTAFPAAEQALSVYGTFRISDGYFSTRHSAGIIFWNTANSSSVILVEGGTIDASVLRSSWSVPGKSSYVQTGGTVILRGDETEVSEMSDVPVFNIPSPSSTFVMTGGDIILRDCNNGTLLNGNGLYLNCAPGNFSVTGGTVTFEVNPVNTPSIDVYSRVSLWNLNVKRLGVTGNAHVNMLYPLVVMNNLSVLAGATLLSGAGNFPVTVNGDFKINQGGTYAPNDNTTSFTGAGNHFLWNEGTITNGLYKLQVNKPAGSLILVSAFDSYTVRSDLSISAGTLADGGKTIYVNGNVINNGEYAGAGKISLNRSTGSQTITGNGSGIFQNIELNNTSGIPASMQVSLGADITVTGVLTLANDRLFSLSKYQLTLKTLATVAGTMGPSRFITTSGAASDGGVRRVYSDTAAFVFPVGSGIYYTPATIQVRKIPVTYGMVTVKPVPFQQPFVTGTVCLQYYWKVEESGFTGIKPGSVKLVFNYGTMPGNILYVPGVYNPASWYQINDVSLVNEASHEITFPTTNNFYGDYTAGKPDAFGTVLAFYSRASGFWGSAATWSNAGYGGIAATQVPGTANPVFIGDGNTYNHVVTIASGSAFSGSLSLKQGSALDLGTTTGNNFGNVLPGSTGKLRISSRLAACVFPAGDFGNFLGLNGGIVEYYSVALNFTLPVFSEGSNPQLVSNYCSLILSPGTGYSIVMPNADLVISGNMTVAGVSSTALVKLNAAGEHILTVNNDLLVNSGNLLYQNNMAQVVSVGRNLTIAGGAVFNLSSSGATVSNVLSIGGSITNNGALDLSVNATVKCDAVFTGNADATISGAGLLTDFYSITVNKGSSPLRLLTVSSTAFTFSNNTAPLTLVNGTFRLASALTVTVAAMALEIPSTACLSAGGGIILVGTSASDDADVLLSGVLEVKAGGIYVGSAANNVNNDIEYSGAGFPAISVTGGTLFVNGQIRRSMSNGLGSLAFSQSDGSVIINGRNGQPTRAKLEILNPGSIFNMAGGTLTLVRGGGSTYRDLYLRPGSASVTGGMIIFGDAATENTLVTGFTIDSNIPLYSITINGTTYPKKLTLAVNKLTLQGDLTISATSVFNADSLDVYIKGNLTNLNTDGGTGINTGGFQPGSLMQLTTFNGTSGNQVITGTPANHTNFAMLAINNIFPGGTVTLQGGTAATTTVVVNGDLTLAGGTLSDGGFVISVLGDIYNSATHTSTGNGRILLAGPAVQYLSGNGAGKFGNLYLSSLFDTRMTTVTEVTGVLTFQGKLLDIGNKLLILSATPATSVVALVPAVFAVTCCIRTNGLISDAGIRKSYAALTNTNFTFPVGVPGKYTPARMNVTATTLPGTITMIPVNSQHPCNTGTGTNILTFYWHVIKAGFSGTTISQYYTYVQSDVKGTESLFAGNRYNYSSGAWDSPASGTAINTTTNLITFGNLAVIDGDYTAGQPTEFGTVLTYYSRNATCTVPMAGNWDVNATWSTDAVNKHAGLAASSYPTGEPVVIASNHMVSTNGNARKSISLTLNGTSVLDLTNTVGHDLGTVTGTGTIRLIPSAAGSFVFPAGFYNGFTATGGGTVELNCATGTAVFPYLNTYNNLTVKGAGIKQMTDADITVNGLLYNQVSGTLMASGFAKLILAANWINDGVFINNGGTVIFDGNTTLSGIVQPVLNNLVINSTKIFTAPALVTLGVTGNWVNNGVFNHNSGTVSFNGTTTISGADVTTFNNLTIGGGGILTGMQNDNFVLTGNWMNNGLFHHNDGGVVFNGTTLAGGTSATLFGKVTVNNGRTLTAPAAGTLSVARDFINNGYFNNNGGTVVFSGTVQSLWGSSKTQFENITVNNGSITTVSSADQTLNGILLCNGSFQANGNLTLLSGSSRTALIDGAGAGEVIGNLNIQRYLPRGFGYKYFTSAFKAATVSQFGSYINLGAGFPSFYMYDENRMFTGWVTYTNPAGLLVPMQGYAANFGPASSPVTLALSGEVNNGNLIPVTMFNGNKPFTQGFNLVGNPYPSPIDWNAQAGWIRDNVDDALYYFNAGVSDQYSGTYSTYINGISSDGVANNIIPAMQGFFTHVSGGQYPVAATLIFTNGVRINNLSPGFHKDVPVITCPLLRLTAKFEEEAAAEDPVVIYFDPDATTTFHKNLDALKLMNTDPDVPNLFMVSDDSENFSIKGLPYPSDSITTVRLGVIIRKTGLVDIGVHDLLRMPSGIYVYLFDSETGIHQNLALYPDYRIRLEPGTYEHRFTVVFSKYDIRYQPGQDKSFFVYSFRNHLSAYVNLPAGHNADLKVYNILGKKMLEKPLSGTGYHELEMTVPTGIYVVTLYSVNGTYSKKVFINNQ
ncbi:MAG: T9SS type A sorting domain-containing protein [Bacteroidota bacterium]